MSFPRIWQYIQPAPQPQTTCNHTSPLTSTSGFFTCMIVWDQPPCQLRQQFVCTTKEFLHKLLETISGKLICVLVILTRVLMSPGFHCTRQMEDSMWRRVGERFANANVENWVPRGGGGVMVWAGINYGQWTQVHFIDGSLNVQRYCEEILRPVVVPFIRHHRLMLQHDNAQLHVVRICTQFLEAENIPVLTWPTHSPDMSPSEHV